MYHIHFHKRKNTVYHLQISAFAVKKFEKCVKYANEMTDDVVNSTQNYIKYINIIVFSYTDYLFMFKMAYIGKMQVSS